jgi:hypothetical protein
MILRRYCLAFQDSNGVSLDLYEYLRSMEDRIRGLEEKIKEQKENLALLY